MRTMTRPTHSYPPDMDYAACVARYAANTIDIGEYVADGAEFRTLVHDDGGHPNNEGYRLLALMLSDRYEALHGKAPFGGEGGSPSP
jgi:lysophospholipase L1-like esterase